MINDPWWIRYPDRLQREESALAAAGLSFRLNASSFDAGVAVVAVAIEGPNGIVELTATFPDAYPYFKPFVANPELGLAHHWNPLSGEVCLLANEGSWRPEGDTLASLLQEQWPAVLAANAGDGTAAGGGLLEIDQAEPFTVYLDPEPDSSLTVNGSWPSRGARGGWAILAVASWEPLRGHVMALQDPSRQVLDKREAFYAGSLPVVEVPWVQLGQVPEQPAARELWLAVKEADPNVVHAGWWSTLNVSGSGPGRFGPQAQVILVSLPEEVARRQQGTGWTALVRRRETARKPAGHAKVVRVQAAGSMDLRIRAPELRGLEDKKAAVVGAGGLGSAIVMDLAGVGLKKLTVIDGDFVDPAAAVRFPAAFRFAGKRKAAALADLVSEVQPYTEARYLDHRIGTSRVAASGEEGHQLLERVLGEQDLVLDATADVGVQHYLSDLCAALGMPYLQAEATPGVWAGLVALYRPGGDVCWVCVQHHLTDGTLPRLPHSTAAAIQPPGCAEPTYTGTGFDLATIATHAVRLAVSTLTGKTGYGSFGHEFFTVELRDYEGRPQPAVWTPHALTKHPKCRNHR